MALTFTRRQSPGVRVDGAGTDENAPSVAAYGTTAEWTASGHVLGVGELGLDTTTNDIKAGDGSSLFSALSVVGNGSYVRRAQAYVDWRSKGTAAATAFDTGQTIQHSFSVGKAAAQLSVIDGKLTNTYAGAGGAAGYAEVVLSGTVRRIGGTFTFSAATLAAGGTATIAICSTPVYQSWPSIPDLGCHLSILPDSWGMAVYESGSVRDPASGTFKGTFATPLVVGQEYRVEYIRDGSTVTLLLPDGSVATCSDPSFASKVGSSCFWEVFQDTAATDPRSAWTQCWADSDPEASTATVKDLAAIGSKVRKQTSTQVAEYAPASLTSSAIPSSSTEVNAALRLTVTVPDSGYVLVESELHATITTQGLYIHEYRLGSASVARSRTVAYSVMQGPVRAMARIGPYTPGQTLDLRLYHFIAGGGVGSVSFHEAQALQAFFTARPAA